MYYVYLRCRYNTCEPYIRIGSKEDTCYTRTKHIDIGHHFIRDSVKVGDIELQYCATNDMVADVLTKALARDKHEQHTDTLGVRHSKGSQSGSVESNAGCSL